MLPEGDHFPEDVKMLKKGILILIFLRRQRRRGLWQNFALFCASPKAVQANILPERPILAHCWAHLLGWNSVEQRQ